MKAIVNREGYRGLIQFDETGIIYDTPSLLNEWKGKELFYLKRSEDVEVPFEPYCSEEKLEYMKKKNPVISKLVKEFDLMIS